MKWAARTTKPNIKNEITFSKHISKFTVDTLIFKLNFKGLLAWRICAKIKRTPLKLLISKGSLYEQD